MKVFFPRNISGSWLSMSVSVWPAQVSVIQLILLAFGMGLALVVWNQLVKNDAVWKGTALMLALPIFLLFVFIAFFKYSELNLYEFIAKMIRTYFLDVTQKFQVNYDKLDPMMILLAKNKNSDHDTVIEIKDTHIDKEKLEKLKGI